VVFATWSREITTATMTTMMLMPPRQAAEETGEGERKWDERLGEGGTQRDIHSLLLLLLSGVYIPRFL
jgi:hypothetical protein